MEDNLGGWLRHADAQSMTRRGRQGGGGGTDKLAAFGGHHLSLVRSGSVRFGSVRFGAAPLSCFGEQQQHLVRRCFSSCFIVDFFCGFGGNERMDERTNERTGGWTSRSTAWFWFWLHVDERDIKSGYCLFCVRYDDDGITQSGGIIH